MTNSKISSEMIREINNEVNLESIKQADRRIKSVIKPTPLVQSLSLSDRWKIPIFLKLENLNLSGSFKIRGAANALLSLTADELAKGIVAASAGNHAQGVAYICRLLKVPATIFMPIRTPLVKIESTRLLGANIKLIGEAYDDAFLEAVKFQASTGANLVHAFADNRVINGQGTVGLEIIEQCPKVSAVLVSIGGGGLASGVATAIKSLAPQTKVFGVQSASFPSMKLSMENNQVTQVPRALTIADGIAVKKPSKLTFDILKDLIDEIFLVDDDAIAAAIMHIMEKEHNLAEGAGAASVAAIELLLQKYGAAAFPDGICAIVSGGNIDVNLFSRITTRGLIHSGRMMRLAMRVEDRPGKLAEILNIIGESGANLLDVRHSRTFGAMYYSEVDIEIDLETSNFSHQSKIKTLLQQHGF